MNSNQSFGHKRLILATNDDLVAEEFTYNYFSCDKILATDKFLVVEGFQIEFFWMVIFLKNLLATNLLVANVCFRNQ